METLFIPTESDFKRWVREAVHDYFQSLPQKTSEGTEKADELINRKDAAKLLKISLVTLHARMKKGLPYYKQEGSVYFIKSEVVEYLRQNNSSNH